jgi:hypothetical protein
MNFFVRDLEDAVLDMEGPSTTELLPEREKNAASLERYE